MLILVKLRKPPKMYLNVSIKLWKSVTLFVYFHVFEVGIHFRIKFGFVENLAMAASHDLLFGLSLNFERVKTKHCERSYYLINLHRVNKTGVKN